MISSKVKEPILGCYICAPMNLSPKLAREYFDLYFDFVMSKNRDISILHELARPFRREIEGAEIK